MVDVTVYGEDVQMKLHKVIVCAQSSVLQKAFTSGFKVQLLTLAPSYADSFSQDSNENIYWNTDDQLLLLSKMAEYFYAGGYDENGLENGEKHLSSLDLHDKMFALADKYDVQSLCRRGQVFSELMCQYATM
jgi:hypothetical protein